METMTWEQAVEKLESSDAYSLGMRRVDRKHTDTLYVAKDFDGKLQRITKGKPRVAWFTSGKQALWEVFSLNALSVDLKES